MKKNFRIAVVGLTIFLMFTVGIGCSGIRHQPDNHFQKLAEGQKALTQAVNSQTEAIKNLLGGTVATKSQAPPPAAASAPAPKVETGMISMEEITGKPEVKNSIKEESLPSASKPAVEATKEVPVQTKLKPESVLPSISESNLAKDVSELKKVVASHGKRLNSLEYFQAKIDREVIRLGANNPSQLDGWEFGYYAYGSTVVHKQMLDAMSVVASQLKKEKDKAAKKGETLNFAFTFTSFTDEKGSSDANTKIGIKRTENCRDAFLKILKKEGITSISTKIQYSIFETRGVTDAVKRYTLVEVERTTSALPPTSSSTPAPDAIEAKG